MPWWFLKLFSLHLTTYFLWCCLAGCLRMTLVSFRPILTFVEEFVYNLIVLRQRLFHCYSSLAGCWSGRVTVLAETMQIADFTSFTMQVICLPETMQKKTGDAIFRLCKKNIIKNRWWIGCVAGGEGNMSQRVIFIRTETGQTFLVKFFQVFVSNMIE